MSSFDTNTRSQTLASFIDGFIHDRLLQSTPHVDETLLQFGDVTNSRWGTMQQRVYRTLFAASYPRFYSQQDSHLGCWVATDLVR